MCGRYSLFTPKEKVEETLQATAVEWENWQARYNAAPSQPMPVITNEFPGIIQYMRWGLVPKWAKDMQVGSKMINTRSESIREKPSFFNIFK
ncbi:MAG: SOS response-associated peptidase family protein, partial [Chitinophagaceae bacterium]|nr:SOS response-associated peptidase family protein [Chitinophagaceae bacterium]